MRFLALSLDGVGIRSYGDCSLVCRESMIEHRASLFEMNSAVFVGTQAGFVRSLPSTLNGRRAVWGDRVKLCAAKLQDRLTPGLSDDDFAAVLVTQGQTSADDDFVEVNIYGSMTIRTFEKIVVHDARLRRKRAWLASLREKLERFGVALEVQ